MKIEGWKLELPLVFTKLIKNEYKTKEIYPKEENIFKALELTQLSSVKVVILGQDPYHGENQANGLAFSVNSGIKIPPSLRNIFKELENDLHIRRENGNLYSWAKEGVLLLNTILTVEKGKPLSHEKLGWEKYTDNIIKEINEKNKPVVFILWGNNAKKKRSLITNSNHLILEAVHPSPLSANRGFFGSKPFSKANSFLIKTGQLPINW